MSHSLRDALGRFTGTKEPDLGPFWIEAPSDPREWGSQNSCKVIDVRRPLPDPNGLGGQGFESVFSGTYAECDVYLEAQG